MKGSKAQLRNFLIDQHVAPDVILTDPVTHATWIFDGFSLYHQFKPKATYRDWFESILTSIQPPNKYKAARIEIINDYYLHESVKANVRYDEISRRVHLTSVQQNMLQGEEWKNFFSNPENKNNLTELALDFFRSLDGRKLLRTPMIFTCAERRYEISQDGVELLQYCNHLEADSKMIYQACCADMPVVVVAKDTDVFVLMIHAMSKTPITKKWLMSHERDHYIDISKVVLYLGTEICRTLPQIHAMTGCDTTAYKFGVSKISTIKKIIKNVNFCKLIENLGKEKKLTADVLDSAKKFIQVCLYRGKLTENYVETRIRLYNRMKTKASCPLPPDHSSCINEIKRIHMQCLIWLNCTERVLDVLNPEEYGWVFDTKIQQFKPLWYNVTRFPPAQVSKEPMSKRQRLLPSTSTDHSLNDTDVDLANIEEDNQWNEENDSDWQDDWTSDSSAADSSSDEDFIA